MDGPNVTQLRSKVVEECDKEARVAAGSTTRDTLAIQEAVPGEARVVSNLVHLVIIFCQHERSWTVCTRWRSSRARRGNLVFLKLLMLSSKLSIPKMDSKWKILLRRKKLRRLLKMMSLMMKMFLMRMKRERLLRLLEK